MIRRKSLTTHGSRKTQKKSIPSLSEENSLLTRKSKDLGEVESNMDRGKNHMVGPPKVILGNHSKGLHAAVQ